MPKRGAIFFPTTCTSVLRVSLRPHSFAQQVFEITSYKEWNPIHHPQKRFRPSPGNSEIDDRLWTFSVPSELSQRDPSVESNCDFWLILWSKPRGWKLADIDILRSLRHVDQMTFQMTSPDLPPLPPAPPEKKEHIILRLCIIFWFLCSWSICSLFHIWHIYSVKLYVFVMIFVAIM